MSAAVQPAKQEKADANDVSVEIEEIDKSAKPKAKPAEAGKSAEAKQSLSRNFRKIHATASSVNGYCTFLMKYILVQLFTLAGSFSFLVLASQFRGGIDFSNMSLDMYLAFGVVGVLNVLGRVLPGVLSLVIDDLKMELSCAQVNLCHCLNFSFCVIASFRNKRQLVAWPSCFSSSIRPCWRPLLVPFHKF